MRPTRDDHDACRADLGALLDAELPAAAQARLREHVEGCASCREELAQLAKISRDLRMLPREPMPEGMKADLKRRAQGSGAGDAAAPWMSLPQLAFGTLAAGAIVAALALVPWTEKQAPRVETSAPEPGAPDQAKRPAPPAAAPAPMADAGTLEAPGYAAKGDSPDKRSPSTRSAPFRAARSELERRPARPSGARDDSFAASPVPPDLPAPAAEGTGRIAGADPQNERQLEDPAASSQVVAGPSIYTARLDVAHGRASLAELRAEPVAPSAGLRALAERPAEQDRARASAPSIGAPGPHDDAPAAGETEEIKQEGSSTFSPADEALAGRRGPEARLFFHVQVDQAGRVTHAELVGARLESPEVVEAVRGLLLGAILPGPEGAAPRAAIVSVRIPAAP